MRYESLDDVIRDPVLELQNSEHTPHSILETIDNRLRSMQADTVSDTPDNYKRLIEARNLIIKILREERPRKTIELAPVPTVVLERLLDVISSLQSMETSRASAQERMLLQRRASTTKASKDFRNQRTIPLATIGSLVVALWGTRQAFGVDLTHTGTQLWTIGAGAIIVIAFGILYIAWRVQAYEEGTLRALFDPDVQAHALQKMERSHGLNKPFSRSEFREALAFSASGLRPAYMVPQIFIPRKYLFFLSKRPIRSGRILSTVDLSGAAEDATELALSRFLEMKAVELRVRRGDEQFLLAGGEDS